MGKGKVSKQNCQPATLVKEIDVEEEQLSTQEEAALSFMQFQDATEEV